MWMSGVVYVRVHRHLCASVHRGQRLTLAIFLDNSALIFKIGFLIRLRTHRLAGWLANEPFSAHYLSSGL